MTTPSSSRRTDYYPHDDEWGFGGTLEKMMHDIDLFERECPLGWTRSNPASSPDSTFLASEVLSTEDAVRRLAA